MYPYINHYYASSKKNEPGRSCFELSDGSKIDEEDWIKQVLEVVEENNHQEILDAIKKMGEGDVIHQVQLKNLDENNKRAKELFERKFYIETLKAYTKGRWKDPLDDVYLRVNMILEGDI